MRGDSKLRGRQREDGVRKKERGREHKKRKQQNIGEEERGGRKD